ncbi:RNA polymerase sigma factor SigJ [Pseudaminobacter sp. 19-2017]|uniref:RNA polymerase sigma factor SigJ n=1 Tax=Pseudaminobacter soli (ex Zhang et al. 2022) TaxID=2831468 RepID=A0A942DV54_9HYPH|nr:RNA polymerase sigma factor SigJ [Pseudaminobacter soli]MBS3647161.1 RNA polymerase sigma factor SigJ [Pseudaminobacter soli]
MTLKNRSVLTANPASSVEASHIRLFEEARPRLLGLAYRILGSRAEAEDAVQDTFLRWQTVDVDSLASPGAWLTMVCTRRAIDMLRASYRSRVDYVGNWLPEPVHTVIHSDAEAQMELSSSLSTAFLLMLERLTPKERAAYLLYEIFELSYADVASSLDMNEPACRKLVSRAKARVGDDQVRYRPSAERQEELLAAFEDAIRTGQPGPLAAMLASDVRLTADGGGKAATVIEILEGNAVMAFLTERLNEWWAAYEWSFTDLNGSRGLVLREREKIVATVSFAYDSADRIADIFIVRNPDKLEGLGEARIH